MLRRPNFRKLIRAYTVEPVHATPPRRGSDGCLGRLPDQFQLLPYPSATPSNRF